MLASYDQVREQLQILQVMEGNPTLRDAVSSVALPLSKDFYVPADGMFHVLVMLVVCCCLGVVGVVVVVVVVVVVCVCLVSVFLLFGCFLFCCLVFFPVLFLVVLLFVDFMILFIVVAVVVYVAEGPELTGKMLTPPGFNPSQQYPVLVYVYGGPNSQVVRDKLGPLYHSFVSTPPPSSLSQVSDACMLNSLSRLFWVSNLSLILASVDGRGTGLRGDQ